MGVTQSAVLRWLLLEEGVFIAGFRELILGGARSGKSRMAEQRSLDSGLALIYVATATVHDGEMAARVERHQSDRDERFNLIEEPLALASVLQQHQSDEHCILVDCLTLWLSNCLHAQCWDEQRKALFSVLPKINGHVVLVSNETGLGVVPMGELSRRFVDEAGLLHQELAGLCDRVTLSVAGLPLQVKPPGASA